MDNTRHDEYVQRCNDSILGTYKRFPAVLTHGRGSYVYDVNNKQYLDFASGIAVTSLGHAHPEITATIEAQAKKMLHCSSLYYNIPQIELAEKLVSLSGPGKIFFCNSGAEANESLIKLARSYGQKVGRYHIITMNKSFHGRTMAGISATGQDKIKNGFQPLLEGFTHVPFNDLKAIENACTEKTVAVMIEGIQGEGGIIPAEAAYLTGLRKFCTDNNILLLIDAVQCGFFRSGSFQSYQEILSGESASTVNNANFNSSDFIPDGIAMAKSLGGGVPIGASWIRDTFTDYLPAGSHGSTYGGNPLVCAVASKIIEIIERDKLQDAIRESGTYLQRSLAALSGPFPEIISGARGLGLLQGAVLKELKRPAQYESLTPAAYLCLKALEEGLLLVPAGETVIRFLPQFQVTRNEIDEGIRIFEKVLNIVSEELRD